MKGYNSKRHETLSYKLKEMCKDRIQPSYKNTVIAAKLKLSAMTVYNYTTGRVADGYLGEDILELLKKEKLLK